MMIFDKFKRLFYIFSSYTDKVESSNIELGIADKIEKYKY